MAKREGEEHVEGGPEGTPEGSGGGGGEAVDAAEHNRVTAELRRAKRALAKREETDAAAAETARQAEAVAASDYDAGLAIERGRREKLERRLQARESDDAVRTVISTLGFAGDQASALAKLVSRGAITFTDEGEPDVESVSTAVEATLARYPTMFGKGAAAAEPERVVRNAGPSAPSVQDKPTGYITPEEYEATPRHVRLTPEFQARVEVSRPCWFAEKPPADSF